MDGLIDPQEWRVMSPFVHGGIRYGPGDPVPTLTPDETERLRAEGALVMVQPDGTVETPPPAPPPATPADYLAGPDLVVLRRIHQHRPNKWKLKQLLDMAVKGRRSQILIEAIHIAMGQSTDSSLRGGA